ncbi:MAG: substrate-binding domain-containing protein, partial [Desulfomicrobium sp.]|nr:substrate-binding domain-containing protein [Desulfomicrobium sp.]
MLKYIFTITSLLLLLPVHGAFAAETVRGAGIGATINIVENVTRPFNNLDPALQVTHKEMARPAEVVDAVGKGERAYGLINRNLNDKDKETYPDLQAHLFAKDGIVVAVNAKNPVTSITAEQLKLIMQGKITNWAELGGKRGVITMMTLRDKRDPARGAFEKYVLGKEKAAVGKVREVGSLRNMRDEIELDDSAMGYLLMSGAGKKVRTLEIDGHAPKKDGVKDGTYPMAVSFNIITNGDPSPGMQKFMDFMYSPEGGKLV